MDTRSTITTVHALLAAHRRSDKLLFIAISVIVLCLAPILVLSEVTIGFSAVLGSLAVLSIAALIIWRPLAGFYVITACVVLIEQEPLLTPIITDRLYIFYWPPSLEGQIERPVGFLLIFIFFTFVCHRLVNHERLLQGGKLLLPFLFYLLCVAGGVVHGLASGGDLKFIVLEIRPFWYLFVSYLLAYNFVKRKSHVRIFFWIVIMGAGIKALQGLYIYLVVLHGDLTGQDHIMSHEESFFFASLLILLILLCLHHRYRPQLYATLLILPFVLVALIANQRRADYVALLVGLAVVWTLLFWIKPYARKGLVVSMLICVTLGVGYIAAFSHSTGGFAAPAHAIVSVFNPDNNKIDSNLYRLIENNDLIFTVKQNPLFGLGFGKPFPQPTPLTSIYPDVLAGDPVYNYVPHNTIYWVWMRLGPIGFFALWYLFGSIIVRGCLTARQLRDPYLQLVAIYIVAVTFVEVIVAFADYQLYFYRNVIYLGLLVGILMKLYALDENEKREMLTYESTPRRRDAYPLLKDQS